MKVLQNKKIFGITLSTALIVAIIILAIVLSVKKNKRLETECEKRNGSWDKKQKKCNFKSSESVEGSNDDFGETIPPSSGSGNTSSYDPKPLAQEIYNKMEGWNWLVYPELSDKILALNDSQLRSLYEYYNNYLAEEYATLTLLFANEWNQSYGKYEQVVNRLKSLNLN